MFIGSGTRYWSVSGNYAVTIVILIAICVVKFALQWSFISLNGIFATFENDPYLNQIHVSGILCMKKTFWIERILLGRHFRVLCKNVMIVTYRIKANYTTGKTLCVSFFNNSKVNFILALTFISFLLLIKNSRDVQTLRFIFRFNIYYYWVLDMQKYFHWVGGNSTLQTYAVDVKWLSTENCIFRPGGKANCISFIMPVDRADTVLD